MVYFFRMGLNEILGDWIMKQKKFENSQIINGIALGFSLLLFLSAFAAALYTGEWGRSEEHTSELQSPY